jgi:uncharacterized protein YlxW (UPF0749 family)
MRSRSAERRARWQRLAIISAISLVLGFVFVVQLRSQAVVARSLAAQDDTSVALLIDDLNRANNQLTQQLDALSQQQAALQQALAGGGTDSKAIETALTTLRAVNGEIPVHGPGLEIRIDGSIADFELEDALNSLRNAGAEAISLNGYRLVASTSIATGQQGLVVDGHAVSSPFDLLAVGDPDQLGPAADLSASTLQTRVQVTIARQTDIAISEVIAAKPLVYAQLGR